MSALAELQKRARAPANLANLANRSTFAALDSQDSQDSQWFNPETAFSGRGASTRHVPAVRVPTRDDLLALAAAEWIDPAHVHRQHDLDVAACIGLDTRQLAAYLAMLADTANRRAGRVPAGDTAAIHCEQCGPVWIHPTIAEVLPVVGGWARALGCPWCFVRKAGGYIPRPSVTCEGCRHFTPDTINPAAGMGTCGAGKGTHWPMASYRCEQFWPP